MNKNFSKVIAATVATSAIVAPISSVSAAESTQTIQSGFYYAGANGEAGKYFTTTEFQNLDPQEKLNYVKNSDKLVVYLSGLGVAKISEVITSGTAAKAFEANGSLNTKTPEKFFTGEYKGTDGKSVVVGEATPPVVGEVKVESVSAINGSTVEVKFTQPVKAGTATGQAEELVNTGTDDTSAVVEIEGLFLQNPTLSDDGMTLTLTAKNQAAAAGSVSQAIDVTNAKVSVAPVESKTDANVKTKAFASLMTYKDTVAPTVTSERVSANQIKVKFSEPVVFAAGDLTAEYADTSLTLANTDVKVGGTNLVAVESLVSAPKSELTLTLDPATVENNKDIIVTMNGVKDVKGNLITPQPAKVTVSKKAGDTVAPKIASVTQTGAKTFNIKFDKDIIANDIVASDDSTVTVTNGTVTKVEKVSGNEYKVTVGTPVKGVQTVTVVAGAAKNLDGTAATALTKTMIFAEDTVAPKAISKVVKNINNQEVIELTFDKDVEVKGNGKVTVSGTQVKDFVNETVTADVTPSFPVPSNKKVIQIPLSAPFNVEGAVYDLKIKNVDTSNGIVSDFGVAMDEATAKFTRGEIVPAPNQDVFTAADITIANVSGNNDEVEVKFNLQAASASTKRLDGVTASNVANYSIDGAQIESATLQAAVTSGNPSTQSVILKLKKNSNSFTGVRNATVKNVKFAGSTKVMETVTKQTTLTENVLPTIVKADLTANDKVTITFSEAMAAVDMKDAFLVKAGTETLATTATTATASGKTVVLTIVPGLTQEQLAKTITVEPAKTAAGVVDTTKLAVVKDAATNGGNKLEEFSPITVIKP